MNNTTSARQDVPPLSLTQADLLNVTPETHELLTRYGINPPPTRLDRHGRPFTVGDVILDRVGEASAGVVTTIDSDVILYAPFYDDDEGDSSTRLRGMHGEVEVVARPPAGFDPLDLSFREVPPIDLLRERLLVIALSTLRASQNTSRIPGAIGVFGNMDKLRVALVHKTSRDLRHAAETLLKEADYALVRDEGEAAA
jgi:hypothetical protein